MPPLSPSSSEVRSSSARDTLERTGGTQGEMIIHDSLGNLLIMGANPGTGVGLCYAWAPFVRAVGEPP